MFDAQIQMREMTTEEAGEVMAIEDVKKAVSIIKQRGPLDGRTLSERK